MPATNKAGKVPTLGVVSEGFFSFPLFSLSFFVKTFEFLPLFQGSCKIVISALELVSDLE